MRRLIVVLAIWTAACGGSKSPTAPSQPVTPPAPACQLNNTASIAFENRLQGTTLDVIWDGVRLTTLTPGAISQRYTFAAGVQHSLWFLVTNTTIPACSEGRPTLTQCSSGTYFCPG